MRGQVPTTEQLLDVVGSIYESALAPVAMNAALAKLSQCINGVASQLYTWDLATGQVLDSHTESIEASAASDKYRDHYGQIDPRAAVLARLAPGGTVRCHKLCDERFVQRNEFYQDFFIPAGWRWAIGGKYGSSDGSVSIVASVRELGRPAYEDWAERTLQTLLPHFQRAAYLRAQLAGRLAERITATGLLKDLPVGCLILDLLGRILGENQAAAEALRDLPVRRMAGHLHFNDPALRGAWSHTLGNVSKSRVPGQIRVTGRAAGSWQLHVLPCSSMVEAADSREQHLLLAVFELTSASKHDKVARARVRYQLTVAEGEVLGLLLDGVPLKRIASIRGAQPTTVRTQVSTIFDKTGYRSQRELIAALSR